MRKINIFRESSIIIELYFTEKKIVYIKLEGIKKHSTANIKIETDNTAIQFLPDKRIPGFLSKNILRIYGLDSYIILYIYTSIYISYIQSIYTLYTGVFLT